MFWPLLEYVKKYFYIGYSNFLYAIGFKPAAKRKAGQTAKQKSAENQMLSSM